MVQREPIASQDEMKENIGSRDAYIALLYEEGFKETHTPLHFPAGLSSCGPDPGQTPSGYSNRPWTSLLKATPLDRHRCC